MTKTLKWRLSKLPTPEELVELVKSKIITQEEAKEILLSSETEEDRDKKSLESEIKFLRDLIIQMNRTGVNVVESIKYVEKPYRHWDWYSPTVAYFCGDSTSTLTVSSSNLIN